MLASWVSGITPADTILGDRDKIKLQQVKSVKHLLLPSTLCTLSNFFSFNSYVPLNSTALQCFSLTFSLLTLIVLSFLKAQTTLINDNVLIEF